MPRKGDDIADRLPDLAAGVVKAGELIAILTASANTARRQTERRES